MRAALIFLLVLAVGAAFFAWERAGSTEIERPLEAVPAPIAQSPEPLVQACAPTALREATSAPASIDSKPTPPIPIDDRVAGPPTDAEWAKAYDGWASARLEARLLELEANFHAEVERLCEMRFAAGMYRTIPAEEMEGDDNAYDALATLDGQGMLMRTRAVPLTELDPTQPLDGDGEGRIEYQIASLPQDVYPQLYSQRSEVEWLRSTLAARLAAGEDPP